MAGQAKNYKMPAIFFKHYNYWLQYQQKKEISGMAAGLMMMKPEVDSIERSGSTDKKIKSLVFSKYAECCYQTSKAIKEESSIEKWNAIGKYSKMTYNTDEYIKKLWRLTL